MTTNQPEVKKTENGISNPSPPNTSHPVLNVTPKPELESATNQHRTENTMDEQEIQRIKAENSIRKLPRKAKIGDSSFFISYSCLIYSGKYSIHHIVRTPDKQLFSLKIDDRNPAMVLRDETIRSKLLCVDLPKIVASERRNNITFNVMEPLSMTFKNLIRGFSMRRENRPHNSAILLRIGRMCIRLLKSIHDNGVLHGNINPHTFVLPCNPDGQDTKPDLKRGPIIIDFSHAIDTKEDPLYKEATPQKRFSSAIYSEDGGIYTKRDDMENLGYLLLFLANGHICWEVRKRRDLLLFGKKCLSELDRNLKGIPLVIKNYITYVRTIKWNATPDYELLDLCLTSKNFDIRAEIRARRERLKLKRKRESARGRSQKVDTRESALKAQREKTAATSKRQRVHKNVAFQDNSVSAEHEPEYFVMSLQLYPDIAVKISVPDEDTTNMHINGMAHEGFAFNRISTRELNEDQKFDELDDSFTTSVGSNEQERGRDVNFLIPGTDRAVDGVEDGFSDAEDTATKHVAMLPRNVRTTHTNLMDYREDRESVFTRCGEAIQFYFPSLASENEDMPNHPWDDVFGS